MTGPADLACVVHCHSLHSDGTGTVAEIAAAADAAGVDVVLLTDHDTLAARRLGEERWHGDVLVCVGEEVSPPDRDHCLAFGVREEIDPTLSPRDVCAAVAAQGGISFAAHPFSRGFERLNRPGMPFSDLDAPDLTGIELWSWVTDSAEQLRSLTEVARFIATPQRIVDHPPLANLRTYDQLSAKRRLVAIGGIDAHQIGRRIGGRVPLRLMSYRRSFSHLRTHVLLDAPPSGDAAADRDAVYAALRTGRCYLAIDSLASARGFELWASDGEGRVAMGAETSWRAGQAVHVRVPRPASISLLRDGAPVAATHGIALDYETTGPGVHRVQVTLPAYGRERTWILSNPVYLSD